MVERACGRLVVCVLSCLSLAGSAMAQVGAGGVTGEVSDQAGASVPGVTVTVTAASTNRSRTAVTATDGRYVVSGLPPGVYTVRAAIDGFRPLTREGIRVTTGETVRLDLELQIGAQTEAVTVTGDAPLLRSETASLGQVIDNRKIVELPLNGRSFITLAGLAPAVALPPGSSLPRINGGRPRTNEYLFDGISVLQPEPGQVAFFPNVDAIQEFKIETNSPPAEFGRFNGGVVNLTTRSGGNTLHGTAFEFFRNESLNARNYFASTNPVKPKFRRNQFGGVIGGPIRQDRSFFFGDYQGQRQTIGRTVISTVPTTLQRQGVFSEAIGGRVPVIYDPATTTATGLGTVTRTPFPGNIIPAERMDEVGIELLQRYPLPTSSGTANNFRRVADETVDQDQFSGRIDHRFGSNDQVFGRLTRFSETFIPVTPLPEGSGVTSGTLGPQDTTAWSFASSYQKTISPTLLNEVRVGDTRRSVGRAGRPAEWPSLVQPGLTRHPIDVRAFPTRCRHSSSAAISSSGRHRTRRRTLRTSVTQIADTLTWLKGRHTLKLGADLRWERLECRATAVADGLVYVQQPLYRSARHREYGHTARQLPARTGAAVLDRPAAGRDQEPRAFPGVLRPGRLADLRPADGERRSALHAELPLNRGRTIRARSSTLILSSWNTWAATVSREPPASSTPPTSARGSASSAAPPTRPWCERGYGLVWIEQAGITTPFTTPSFPFLQTVSQRTLDNINPAFVLANGPSVDPLPLTPTAGIGQGVFAVDRDLGSGYVQQWNVSVQREITSNISVEVAYVGSKITHVGIPDTNLNQLTVEQLAQGRAAAAARAESVLRTNPAVVVARRSDDSRCAAAQAVSRVHDRQPLSKQCRNDALQRVLRQGRAAVLARSVVPCELHALEAGGRCVIGVRCLDPDRTDCELPCGGQLQSSSRARLLHW